MRQTSFASFAQKVHPLVHVTLPKRKAKVIRKWKRGQEVNITYTDGTTTRATVWRVYPDGSGSFNWIGIHVGGLYQLWEEHSIRAA